MKKWKYSLGERYTYPNKDWCYEASLKVIEQGYQVRYGVTQLGNYYFEIVDPFERSNNNANQN